MELTQYVTPHPQAALGGELGLTSQEIAKGLGVPVKRVHKKLGYGTFVRGSNLAGFKAVPIGTGNDFKGWVLDLNAARAFVARWDSETGWGYLKHLLDCEAIVQRDVPKLFAEIGRLKDLIEKLTAPKQRQLPGRGIVQVITRVLRVVDMFGEVEDEIVREKKYYDELSPAEKEAYKAQHRAAVMRGLAMEQDRVLNRRDKIH